VNLSSPLEMEKFIGALFERMDYTVVHHVRFKGLIVDMVVTSPDGVSSPVELLTAKNAVVSHRVADAARRLHSVTFDGDVVSPMLIAIPTLTLNARALATDYNLRVWDLKTLKEKAQLFPDLSGRLAKLLGEEPSSPVVVTKTVEKAGADLISRLEAHIEENLLSPTEYENLCQQVFLFVFDPYLYDFRRQMETTDGGNRYDFICRIRSGNSFWDSLRTDFRTRAILFECKNYDKKITADQVYSTERYLFSTALRTVCFLVSRLGPNEGCKRAAQGAMRESGKLVLLLSNEDMINLIKLTTEENGPTDYLDAKIWDFVVSLPR